MKTIFDGLDRDLRNILKGSLRDLWTHSSTALEGNSLTLGETSFLLQEGLTIKGKPLKDHNEVSGHAHAIDSVYQLLEKETLTEQDIFELHKTVMFGAPMDIYSPVGSYKTEDNYTLLFGGGAKQYPSPAQIPALMKEWLELFNYRIFGTDKNQAIHNYSLFHLTFTEIHPFADGNGRLARLLANLPVLEAGLPPITISSDSREEYIKILQEYSLKDSKSLELNKDMSVFKKFIADQWKETIKIYEDIFVIQKERKIKPTN